MKNPQSELREHLNRDESLLWSAQPKSGIVFRSSDAIMIPFSILWCGFAIFWLMSVISTGAPIFFIIWGIPFVIMGLIFVFGRFLIDAKQRANTFYGLTENRILIKSGIFSSSIKSLNIKTLSDIELNEKADGTGTISMGPKNPFNMWGAGMSWYPGMKTSPQIELIKNARKVYQQIIEVQNSHSLTNSPK